MDRIYVVMTTEKPKEIFQMFMYIPFKLTTLINCLTSVLRLSPSQESAKILISPANYLTSAVKEHTEISFALINLPIQKMEETL